MPAMLDVKQVTKVYPTAEGSLEILHGVDLEMNLGDALAITGPSGSGKSSLLYLLGALDAPTSGTVTLDGTNPHTLSAAEQAIFRNHKVGFVFQDHYLLPQCTVLENVLIPTLPGKGVTEETQARAESLLSRVGLDKRLGHRPSQLSGGERQRVAVCRALINQPVLLLADEPTGNLDRATADSVGALLLELNKELSTLLICVTHSQPLASQFPQHHELQDGKLVPV